jgi:hypothetical protein
MVFMAGSDNRARNGMLTTHADRQLTLCEQLAQFVANLVGNTCPRCVIKEQVPGVMDCQGFQVAALVWAIGLNVVPGDSGVLGAEPGTRHEGTGAVVGYAENYGAGVGKTGASVVECHRVQQKAGLR